MKRARLTAGLLAVVAAVATGVPAAGSPVQRPEHGISEDTTWKRAGSPYVFHEPVVIYTGVTLTIEPGVRVETPLIEAYGALRAEGTPAERIVFTGVDGARWAGIYLATEATPASAVHDAWIEDARNGLYMTDVAFSVHDTVFVRNDVGIFVENPGTNLTFTGNELYSNGTALSLKTRGVIGIYENDFWDNEIAMSFRDQSPYACTSDGGIFQVSYNDILRGPSAPWFSHDVRTGPMSATSGMVVNATGNWWGTTDEEDIAARTAPEGRCCGGTDRTRVVWREPADAPQTPAEPPGPVGKPEYDPGIVGDYEWTADVKQPEDRDCLQPLSLRRIRGAVHPAVGETPRSVPVALVRVAGTECRPWDHERQRFGARAACSEVPAVDVRVRQDRWRLSLGRALPPGRYWVRAGGTWDGEADLVRFRVVRD